MGMCGGDMAARMGRQVEICACGWACNEAAKCRQGRDKLVEATRQESGRAEYERGWKECREGAADLINPGGTGSIILADIADEVRELEPPKAKP